MLVLSRLVSESIIIEVPPSPEPQKIVVTVVDVRGEKVRLGCTSNQQNPIHRQEVYEAIVRKHGENRPGQKQE